MTANQPIKTQTENSHNEPCTNGHHEHHNEHKHKHHEHGHEHEHEHEHEHGHEHEHEHEHGESTHTVRRMALSLILMAVCIVLDMQGIWADDSWIRLAGYLLSFLPVGLPVLVEAVEITRGDTFFNECTLMFIAGMGAFYIRDYKEAVMLMCLYALGEIFEGKAVESTRKSITSLIDSRSDTIRVWTGTDYKEMKTEEVPVGSIVLVQTGDIVPLDGKLLGDQPHELDLSALTGESMPVTKNVGDEILAGSVSRMGAFRIEVTKPYGESTLSRIMKMSEEAAQEKPKTELFIRRFARVYTPIVFSLALLIIAIPYLFQGAAYDFDQQLYRGLVFLVTSCPCALVISVPLSYFSGLGAASRNGLLFKGAIYLEALRRITGVIFDKTGTLTEGTFEHVELTVCGTNDHDDTARLVKSMEQHSNHPVAQAVVKSLAQASTVELRDLQELAGRGMVAKYGDETLCLGNLTLMEENGVPIPDLTSYPGKTVLYFSRSGQLAATITLSDAIKPTSHATVTELHKRGIKPIVMLSGDKEDVATHVAKELGLDEAKGGLLPHDKVREARAIMQEHTVAYVGDGLNDAPVMNMAPVGIAMGGLGSDATIEAADIVIQGDDPYALVNALDIAKKTNTIVIENIVFSLSFKVVVMVLATIGYASLTLAIIADVGVTLLAVFNAARILRFRGTQPELQK